MLVMVSLFFPPDWVCSSLSYSVTWEADLHGLHYLDPLAIWFKVGFATADNERRWKDRRSDIGITPPPFFHCLTVVLALIIFLYPLSIPKVTAMMVVYFLWSSYCQVCYYCSLPMSHQTPGLSRLAVYLAPGASTSLADFLYCIYILLIIPLLNYPQSTLWVYHWFAHRLINNIVLNYLV